MKAPSTSAGAIATDFRVPIDVGEPQADELDAPLLDRAQNEVTLLVHRILSGRGRAAGLG